MKPSFFIFFYSVVASIFFLSYKTIAMTDDEDKFSSKKSLERKKAESHAAIPLDSIDLDQIKPGVYESDDIELILHHPLRNFDEQDMVVFDVDQVLITARLDAYFIEHVEKNSGLHKEFLLLEKGSHEKYFLYLAASESFTNIKLMDERTPLLIKNLQEKKVKCIGNTMLHPNSPPDFASFNFDAAGARVALLNSFGINFACAFPNVSSWDFDTLDKQHIIDYPPSFKDGIVFSSFIKKHVTQYALFKKLGIIPKRIVFLDDTIEHVQGMYDAMSSCDIECYAFHYKRKTTKQLLTYFTHEVFKEELKLLEDFIKELLAKKNTDHLLSKTYFRTFILP